MNATITSSKKASNSQVNRLNLFVVIRILFRHLEKVNPRLLVRAKQVLRECDAQKKKGNPDFQNLAFSIETHIRRTVGEAHWNEALKLLAARKRVFGKTTKKVNATPFVKPAAPPVVLKSSTPSPMPLRNLLSTAALNSAMYNTSVITPSIPQPELDIRAVLTAYQIQTSTIPYSNFLCLTSEV